MKKIEQNTRSRAGHLEIHAMSSCQSSNFAQQVSVPWADCNFSVSLCTDPPPLRKNLKGPLVSFFPEGRGGGGSVAGYLVFVPWQIVIWAPTSLALSIPALAKMSSFSMTLLHLNKLQLAKCDVISSMHPSTNTFPSIPLLGPHSVFTISRNKSLILQNWSDLRRFHWQNYIWNWHLLQFNSIRLKPKQGHRENSDVIS